MCLLLPGLVYLLSLSLSGQQGFDRAAEILGSGFATACLVILTWILAHHLFAGIRFLLLDFDVGLHKPMVRYTAWLVHGLAVLSAVIMAGVLL